MHPVMYMRTALSKLHTHRLLLGKHRLRLAVNFLPLNPTDMNNAMKAYFLGLEGVTMN